jgi:uncharacterized membrane protein (DUF106 family)
MKKKLKDLLEWTPTKTFVVGTNETKEIDKEIENFQSQIKGIQEKISKLEEKKKGILSKRTEEMNK